ncbi:hypothetical protein [Mucilaginibacter kameinonensis]|uniref:hypothetical protein n=1 Tax=Mucilaginibacter kameinonensis TaxID=452286 RepID=UPI000EF7D910|nr:hypothetical protein [Mucilaginibacter kameinonensis]
MARMFDTIEKELQINADKARKMGYWFCNQQTGHWMTPEEFEIQGKMDLIVHGENCRTVLIYYKMGDPRSQIKRGLKDINQASLKLQEFAEKVFSYFNQVPKDFGQTFK